MSNSIEFTYKTHKNITISAYLKEKGYSDNNIYYLIFNGHLFVNGQKVTDSNFMLHDLSNIYVTLLDEECSVIKTKHDFKILYEDEYYLIVDKDGNLDSEPTKANNENTLANYVASYYQDHNIKSNIHLVNRLDKLTKGIIVFAKNQYIHNLSTKTRFYKEYVCKCDGKIPLFGTIVINIKKDGENVKRVVADDGDKAITKFRRVLFKNNESTVKIRLITGRTHQIRLSMAHIHHPLIGDPLYNPNYKNEEMKLISSKLSFIHPITHRKIVINSSYSL